MNYVSTVKDFIATYPNIGQFIHIDYIKNVKGEFGLMPNGQAIVRRDRDVLGNEEIRKQYNFVLYATNITMTDIARLDNINFLDDFTTWLENTPKPQIGDVYDDEEWNLQNGMLFELNPDKMTGTYQIQINILYTIKKEN